MKRLLAGFVGLTLCLSGCSFGKEKVIEPTAYPPSSVTKEAGIITFMDIGTTTPVLIQNGGYSILVDTGDTDSYSSLKSELESRSISAIDCLIITSPLSERTGAASKLLDDFNVRKVLQPKWSQEVKTSTSSYVEFSNKLQTKSVPFTYTSYGFNAQLGSVKFTALGPQGDFYKDDKNFSMIGKFQFGMVSMLYMSSAYGPAEQELVSGRINTKSDILCVGTMREKESNLDEFVSTVHPSIVLIPGGGKEPSQTMVEKYTDINSEVHWVKDHGNIVITTDGKNIGLTSDYYNMNMETEESIDAMAPIE